MSRAIQIIMFMMMLSTAYSAWITNPYKNELDLAVRLVKVGLGQLQPSVFGEVFRNSSETRYTNYHVEVDFDTGDYVRDANGVPVKGSGDFDISGYDNIVTLANTVIPLAQVVCPIGDSRFFQGQDRTQNLGRPFYYNGLVNSTNTLITWTGILCIAYNETKIGVKRVNCEYGYYNMNYVDGLINQVLAYDREFDLPTRYLSNIYACYTDACMCNRINNVVNSTAVNRMFSTVPQFTGFLNPAF